MKVFAIFPFLLQTHPIFSKSLDLDLLPKIVLNQPDCGIFETLVS